MQTSQVKLNVIHIAKVNDQKSVRLFLSPNEIVKYLKKIADRKAERHHIHFKKNSRKNRTGHRWLRC